MREAPRSASHDFRKFNGTNVTPEDGQALLSASCDRPVTRWGEFRERDSSKVKPQPK